MTASAWHGDPRAPSNGVSCPTCGALPGLPCMTLSGVDAVEPIRGHHAARVALGAAAERVRRAQS